VTICAGATPEPNTIGCVRFSYLQLTDGEELVRAVKGRGSYLSSGDRRVLFGLGVHERVDRLTVRWPDADLGRTGPPCATDGHQGFAAGTQTSEIA
jgi:ASPIC and UnbV